MSRVEATGGHWPPAGIEVLDPWHLPLLNTLILLTSGTTVTWAHHSLLHNDRQGLKWGLALTILLGLLFTCVQAYEYIHAPFAFAGQHLRRHLLHGDRLPRLPRHHRHDLPHRLPGAGAISATSRRSSISASRRPPGTGTSSTWSGCSSSPASTSGGTPAASSRIARRAIPAATTEDRALYPPQTPIATGLRGRCPRCGEGRLFAGFLSSRRAARPAASTSASPIPPTGRRVFVILIVGFVVAGAALLVEIRFSPPIWVHVVLWGPLVLDPLPRHAAPLKGVLVALQYHHRAAEGRIDRAD